MYLLKVFTTKYKDTLWTKGKTHIKKVFFFVVGPLRFYPPYTYGLEVHAIFFFFVLYVIAWNGFWQFYLFLPNFWADFREKKVFLCWVVRGVYPPYTPSGPTTKKKHFLLCVSSLKEADCTTVVYLFMMRFIKLIYM